LRIFGAIFSASFGLLRLDRGQLIAAFVSEWPTRRPDAHHHCDYSATPLL
jgi:hypothetical protein